MINYIMRPIINSRVYLSLNDFIAVNSKAVSGWSDHLGALGGSIVRSLEEVINYGEHAAGKDYTPMDSEDITKTLFQKYLWPRFYNLPIAYFDLDVYPWGVMQDINLDDYKQEVLDAVVPVLERMAAWLLRTKEYYGVLFNAFNEALEDGLLAQVKNSNKSTFNDTPQTLAGESDGYVSSVSRSESATDFNTPAARIREIKNKYEDLYNTWSDEFKKFIIWSASLEA